MIKNRFSLYIGKKCPPPPSPLGGSILGHFGPLFRNAAFLFWAKRSANQPQDSLPFAGQINNHQSQRRRTINTIGVTTHYHYLSWNPYRNPRFGPLVLTLLEPPPDPQKGGVPPDKSTARDPPSGGVILSYFLLIIFNFLFY